MHPTDPAAGQRPGKPLARLRSIVGRLFAAGGIAVSLGFFGAAVYGYYGYFMGSPTPATLGSCYSEQYGYSCTATWDAGGKLHVAKLEGTVPHRYADGSPLNVHVHREKAYTAFSGLIWAGYSVVFAFLTTLGVVKFADADWFDPWLSRRPKWFQRVVRFARGFEDDDGSGWF